MSDGGNGRALSERQRRAWLRLFRTENVGPATFRQLINRFGSAEAALTALPDLARQGGARQIRIASEEAVDAELETAHRLGARFLAVNEPHYPPLLARIDQAPPLIAVMGQLHLLDEPTLSIVGARNASLAGVRLAQRIAGQLGQHGYVIASGLARGIDAAAHHGSLETGTIAALAGGLDQPYPPENRELYAEIAERGVVLSEMPFGWQPRAKDFPRRNRLVAGIGHGLLVVEAAYRSGSLISARLANDMGRLVFAVPGSPLDPRAAGTNRLLKEGAVLVTDADDIVEALAPQLEPPSFPQPLEEPPEIASAPPPGDDERALVLRALGPTPTSIDDIIHHTGLHPAQVSLILLELDLAGRLERHSGGSASLLMGE